MKKLNEGHFLHAKSRANNNEFNVPSLTWKYIPLNEGRDKERV